MSDLLKTKALAWPARLLGELFRINGDQVVPMASSNAEFVHYSIPAWDATGGAAIELGAQIESNKTAIARPSVLVSKLNPRKPRVVAVPSPMERTCCSTEFICYQPKQSNENLNFWADYFSSVDFSARLARVAVGSTNSHTRAAPRETLKWFVPEVPSAQQQKIAQVFDTLDTAIHETEAIIAKLKVVKQGLLNDLLTRGIAANGELRPPQAEAPHLYEESPLGWIPREWEVLPLADVSTTIGDGVHYAVKRSDEGVPFLFVSCIRNGEIDWKTASCVSANTYREIAIKGRPQKGMILFTVVGSYGHAAQIEEEVDFGFERNVAFVMPRSRAIQPRFLFYFLSSATTRCQVENLVIGNAQKVLTLGALKSVSTLAPTIEEQTNISAALDAMTNRITNEIGYVTKLRLQKSGLMDDLLTGRVRVTPLLEPAS